MSSSSEPSRVNPIARCPVAVVRHQERLAGKRIAIVGNAPSDRDLGSDIDATDFVVRFNNAFGYGSVRGSKIDDLFLINCGGQPLEWLQSNAFWQQDHLRRASQVTLPIAADHLDRQMYQRRVPTNLDGVNFESDLRHRLTDLGKPVVTLARSERCAAVSALRESGAMSDTVTPSTGFLAIFSYLTRLPHDARMELYGFGFDGWDGHHWAAERNWVLAQEEAGRLRWHRPSGG